MRANHLLLQKHTGRPVRAHTGDVITLASNMRWCSDMFEILCFNGQKVRIAFARDITKNCGRNNFKAYPIENNQISIYPLLEAGKEGYAREK